MISCKAGNTNLSEFLIQRGANINESNIMGETPLKIAQSNGHDELAVILTTKYKASIKRVGTSLGKIKK
jgi:ankyrin repeat protein